MDYLDAVAFAQFHARPVGTADDGEVVLDGETFGREGELVYESLQRRPVSNLFCLAVEFDLQFRLRLSLISNSVFN